MTKTNEALHHAANDFTKAHRALEEAIREHTEAVAKDAAERGVPLTTFLKAAIANASSARAMSSGGAHASHNVIEALTSDAWIAAANDIHIHFLFKER